MNELTTRSARLQMVFLHPNTKEPFTTSEVIAERTGVERRSIDRLLTQNKRDFEAFGVLRFEIRKPLEGSKGGRPQKVYHLNEQQATLLMTYLRNTEVVRAFKMELVRQFYAMREELRRVGEIKAARKLVRRTVIDAISAMPDSPHKRWKYKHYTDLAYRESIGQTAKEVRENRGAAKDAVASDYMTSAELEKVADVENRIGVLLEAGFDYQDVKRALERSRLALSRI